MTLGIPQEQEIFDAARRIDDAAARAAYLSDACGADASLRHRVEALLQVHDHEKSFLASPALTADLGPLLMSAAPGTVIGRYKILEPIGEGGHGTVFMAEQTTPVQRRVALKIIKAGMDTRQVIARFEAERQALALMDHPNIAKVFDAGVTDAGRPYFVMELVKGTPITRYCDEHKLPPRARLELFIQVCQAVQHAHQKGIIHRDIKPTNVLVAQYDGKPVPKVIDFGVAKATGQRLTDATMFTGFGDVIGTPQYMSPEQAELNQLDVDTRSDVYSLGVLLYELLTGTTPLESKRMKEAAFLEVLRVIREEEPPRPSTRLTTTDHLPSIAAQRGLEPKSLSGIVKGELDWIVMKALEKDRSRRYETANGLVRDIERYLKDEPVEACPPSVGYRLCKGVRRNKGQLLAAGLVVLALVAGIVGTTWQAVRAGKRAEGERLAKEQAQRDRDAKELERQKAEQERGYAQAIADFVSDDILALTTMEGQDWVVGLGDERLGRDASLAQLLDRAAAKLDQRSDLDPRIDAQLRRIVGAGYRGARKPQRAIPILERCVALRAELFGPAHELTLDAQSQLGLALAEAGKSEQALTLLKQTLEHSQETLGPDHVATITHMGNLARSYIDISRRDLALPLFEEAWDRSKKRPRDDMDKLIAAAQLGRFYYEAGDYDQALPILRDAMELGRRIARADADYANEAMALLAWTYIAKGRADLAVPVFEEALERTRKRRGSEAFVTLMCMSNLARGYQAAGKPELALPLLRDAVSVARKNWKPDAPGIVPLMSALGLGLLQARELDEAVPLLDETLKFAREKLGPDHEEALKCMNNLAMAYQIAGKLELAVPLYQEALRLRRSKLENPETLTTMFNLAMAYRDVQKLELALPLLEEAAAGVETRGFQHFSGDRIVTSLIACHEMLNQFDQAEIWRRKWLAVVKKRTGAQSVATTGELAWLGLNLLRQQKWPEAETVLRECLSIRERHEADAWTTFNTQSMIGEALLGQKRYADAEPLLVEGYRGMKVRAAQIPPGAKFRVKVAAERLVRLFEATGNDDEVQKWRQEVEAQTKPTDKAAPDPR